MEDILHGRDLHGGASAILALVRGGDEDEARVGATLISMALTRILNPTLEGWSG